MYADAVQAVIDELPDSDREPVNDDADSLFGNRSSQDDAVGEVAQEDLDALAGRALLVVLDTTPQLLHLNLQLKLAQHVTELVAEPMSQRYAKAHFRPGTNVFG